MIIACSCNAEPQQILIIIDCFHNRYEEQQKLRIFIRSISGREKVDARIGGLALDATQADIDGYGTSAYSAKCREQGFVEYGGKKFNDVEAFFNRVGGYEGITEFYVYDATNVRLREASVGYSLPKKLLGDKFIKDLTISFVGRNLFFIYKNIPYDPDSLLDIDGRFEGFSFYGMPTTRSLGFNIKVTF